MTKYKRSRIYLLLSIREINRLSPEQSKQLEQLEKDLLATKPESDKDKCDHDHLCCPGDIRTVRCAYCGKSMYHEPQEELEVELIKRLKSYKDKKGNIWIKDTGARKKLNSLIKAHNALVKEVRK